jgi:uncharacterized protein (TIGR02284 family)
MTMSAETVGRVTEEQLSGALSCLMSASCDAEAGYDAAARQVGEPALRVLLGTRATERRRFVAELALLRAELGVPSQRPSLQIPPPGWASEPERSGSTDRMLLEQCDRGETVSRKAYEAALREVPLFVMPLRVRTIVQRQYAALLASHAELQSAIWRQ